VRNIVSHHWFFAGYLANTGHDDSLKMSRDAILRK